MPPNKATFLRREERRAKVAQLLRASVPIYRIAEQLGYDRATITADADKLLAMWAAEQKPEDRHRWRALELAKLDEIEIKNFQEAKAGNQGAIDRAIRVMERRSKLLGLDMPSKADIAVEIKKSVHDYTDQEILEIVDRRRRQADAEAPEAEGSED